MRASLFTMGPFERDEKFTVSPCPPSFILRELRQKKVVGFGRVLCLVEEVIFSLSKIKRCAQKAFIVEF